MMQAIAEGFDILKNAGSPKLAEGAPLRLRPRRHRRGLAARQRRHLLAARPHRRGARRATASSRAISGHVEDSGEGRWTVMAAVEEAVPAEVLTAALYARFRSRQEHTFAEKVLSAMRQGFGGHVEPKKPRRMSPPPSGAGADGRLGLRQEHDRRAPRRPARLAVPRRRLVPSAAEHRQDEPRHAADRRRPRALACGDRGLDRRAPWRRRARRSCPARR